MCSKIHQNQKPCVAASNNVFVTDHNTEHDESTKFMLIHWQFSLKHKQKGSSKMAILGPRVKDEVRKWSMLMLPGSVSNLNTSPCLVHKLQTRIYIQTRQLNTTCSLIRGGRNINMLCSLCSCIGWLKFCSLSTTKFLPFTVTATFNDALKKNRFLFVFKPRTPQVSDSKNVGILPMVIKRHLK